MKILDFVCTNVWGLWFTCCLPILLLIGLAAIEHIYTERMRKKRRGR